MEKFKLPEQIETERTLLLKRNHEHDGQMWEAIEESRNTLREWLFWVDGQKSYEDVVKTTEMFESMWQNDTEWAYNIYQKEKNLLLGCVGPHNIIFRNRSAEFGYWLRNSATGKGYMTEAVIAFEQKLFAAGMHRLTICCDVNNQASAHVAQRAGYQLESIAKEATYHASGLHDLAIYVKFSPYPIKGFS